MKWGRYVPWALSIAVATAFVGLFLWADYTGSRRGLKDMFVYKCTREYDPDPKLTVAQVVALHEHCLAQWKALHPENP